MYILKNGKLYTQLGEDKLVGVEIYPDKVITVKGTEIPLEGVYEILTKHEVNCRFQIGTQPYIFPKEVKVHVQKEVVTDEPIGTIQKPTRKSTRK